MRSFVKESLGVAISILLLIAFAASFVAGVLIALGVFVLPALKGAAVLEESAVGPWEAILPFGFALLFFVWLGVWLTAVRRVGPRALRLFARVFGAAVTWFERRELLALDLAQLVADDSDDC